ncbi:MAG TPA: NAD-dependent epimerase/dehydratase family protein [Vicinamibacterales bacterium]|nr:NAD-dependent epimerase/dehydratase family protein [Vicinamibacterales bacterium]
MRILVTGATGFVGSAVVPRLARAGHTVRCLVRPSSDVRRIASVSWERAEGDVRDADSVRRAIEGCDGVVHMASLSAWELIDSPLMGEVVVGGTRNVLDAALAHGGLRMVFVSSVLAVNGSIEPRVCAETDTWTLPDRNLRYSDAKRAAEALCGEYVDRGLPVVIVNPAEIYGPQDTGFITAGTLVDFARSNPVLVCHGGTSVVHVDDVAAGIAAALERGRAGARYILGGENLTVRQLAELTLELLGARRRVVTLPNGVIRFVSRAGLALRIPLPFNPRVIPYATRFWFVDASRARDELGVTFRPARDVLAPTLEWLRCEGHIR